MPNINSFADLVQDQEKLLRAFQDNAATLSPAEAQRDTVAGNLKALQELKARQDSFAAQRQQATQELVTLMKQAREDASRLRALVKGLLGTKNERLVQFKVAPVRSRPRTTVVVVKAAPAVEEPAPAEPQP
jgi:hypothetical protein